MTQFYFVIKYEIPIGYWNLKSESNAVKSLNDGMIGFTEYLWESTLVCLINVQGGKMPNLNKEMPIFIKDLKTY